MKPSGIGGQAVIEGVMMKNKEHYAVAVRTPEKEIVIEENHYHSSTESGIASLPIIRGVMTFIDSLRIGMKTLTYSASFFEEEEEKKEKTEKSEKKEAILMGLTMVVSIAIALAIFFLLPFFISNLLKHRVPSEALRGLIEGFTRVGLFVSYVKAISLMNDIKRVFMYHGAEHKAINCVENGFELTVENVKKQTRMHKRCGTSFLLVVMIISILFFLFIVTDSIWLRMLMRLLLIPVIAGVAYEFIRIAGRSNSKVIEVLSKPGLWLQGLTTKEPDDEMIEVAIASVEAVFDWKAFISEAEDGEEDQLEETAVTAEKSAEMLSESNVEDEIQMVDINDEDEDDIMKALDRYFEAPKKDEIK